MPGGDGTGPLGGGPMTGRGAGYCAGYSMPGYANSIPGRGGWFMYGRGRGRGWRHWYYATGLPAWARLRHGYPAYGRWRALCGGEPTPQEEIGFLNNHARILREQLAEIQNRIQALEKAQAADTSNT